MSGRSSRLTPLDQQKRQAIVRTHQGVVDIERLAIIANRFVVLFSLGKRDGNVLKHTNVGRVVSQRESVGG